MTATADSPSAPDGVDARDDAIRAVEAEFMHMASGFRRLMSRRAERVSPGLLPAGYKVLTTIAHQGPLTASAVVEQLMLDKSQLSRIVSDLEQRGLIARTPDPDDRRAQLLEATVEARAKLDAIRDDPSERGMRHSLEVWDVADIVRLRDLLHALNEDTHGGAF
ncbi:MarR family winged helix-turn-helix transcriptional regulator [Microbacterium halophytorum]|uniref:MarR family winged helix-turn-helix transcriptional regulator n=1 Tax=Microbacterium halophytorum TaxID=2067568 RepID=UPI000CFE1B60|nr:MarR family transcriptional regulator [Microbacterium halophytorum]